MRPVCSFGCAFASFHIDPTIPIHPVHKSVCEPMLGLLSEVTVRISLRCYQIKPVVIPPALFRPAVAAGNVVQVEVVGRATVPPLALHPLEDSDVFGCSECSHG